MTAFSHPWKRRTIGHVAAVMFRGELQQVGMPQGICDVLAIKIAVICPRWTFDPAVGLAAVVGSKYKRGKRLPAHGRG